MPLFVYFEHLLITHKHFSNEIFDIVSLCKHTQDLPADLGSTGTGET